jgi:hypothetical protein
MKKMLLLAALLNGALLAYAQQDNEPAYVLLLDPASGGVIVCEFAENGTKTEGMEILEPFIQGGKLYFVCNAFPAKTEGGDLKPGFEFTLSDESKIKAVYQGTQHQKTQYRLEADFIPSRFYWETSNSRLLVAGFSESGSITITNVFLAQSSFNRWLVTVKLADF